jgi:peptidoglycan/xylan/chitin deacetylase (PgdA/CDA1 family)
MMLVPNDGGNMQQRRASATGWAAVALGLTATVQVLPAATWIPPVRRFFPGLQGRGRPGHIALTFDDGPHPQATAPLLDVLSRCEVRATFFLLGERAAQSPELVREIAGRGHEVGVHGWTHDYTLGRGPRAVLRELRRTTELIEGLVGQRPIWYRPPYGVLSGSALWACRGAGLRPVLWSAWGHDWELQPGPQIATRVLAQLGPGGTVLLHEAPVGGDREVDPPIREAAGLVVRACRQDGLVVGPLAEHW